MSARIATWKKARQKVFSTVGTADYIAPEVVLGRGYAAIAAAADARPEAAAQFASACAIFEAQLDDEAKREDAQFGRKQLETVRARYWPA